MIKKFMAWANDKKRWETEYNERKVNVYVKSSSARIGAESFTKALMFCGVSGEVLTDATLETVLETKESMLTIYDFVKMPSRGSWKTTEKTLTFKGVEHKAYGIFNFKSEENGLKNLIELGKFEELKDDVGTTYALKNGLKVIPLYLLAYAYKGVSSIDYHYANMAMIENIVDTYDMEKQPATELNIIEAILTNKTVAKEKEDMIRKKEESERYIDDYRKKLTQHLMSLSSANKRLVELEDNKYIIKLTENRKITNYRLEGEVLIATTIPLVMTASNGGRYALGVMEVHFNTRTNDVKFFNMTDRRRSCWGSRCNHPHVSDQGNGCLGNASEAIAMFTSQREYSALFDICIAYLESINLDDTAGRFAMNWDKLDEEGNVLYEGCKTADKGYFYYDKTDWKKDRCDYKTYVCKHCGDRHISDEMYRFDEEYVCQECLDEYYTECKQCDEFTLYEDMIDGLCPNCLEEREKKEKEEKAREAERVASIKKVTTAKGEEIPETTACYCTQCSSYHKVADFDMDVLLCKTCLGGRV